MKMTLADVVKEMNSLERHMQRFEEKYSLKSTEFYRLVQAGRLEESQDFHEWLGLYKIWLKRRQKYLELLSEPSPLLELASPLEEDFFIKEQLVSEA